MSVESEFLFVSVWMVVCLCSRLIYEKVFIFDFVKNVNLTTRKNKRNDKKIPFLF